MADDDETVVVLEGEQATEEPNTSERPRNADGTFAPAFAGAGSGRPEPAEDLAEQFKALQREAEGNRHARDEAVRRAQALEQEAIRARNSEAQARSQVAGSQYESIVSGIAAADAEAQAAEQEYAKAYDAGDALAMAKAQRKMAAAESQKVYLGAGKSDLEARHQAASEAPPQRRAEPAERRASGDPVEAFLQSRTEPTRNWLRAHPEHARAFALNMAGGASTEDVRRASKLTAAHNDALAEGIDPDTPAYFSHLEAYIAPREAPQKTPASAGAGSNGATQQSQSRRRSSVPVAPVQASSGGTQGGGPTVRLSKGEVEAATDGLTLVWNYDDPSPEKKFKKGDAIGIREMAKRKLEMQKQGAYDKSIAE